MQFCLDLPEATTVFAKPVIFLFLQYLCYAQQRLSMPKPGRYSRVPSFRVFYMTPQDYHQIICGDLN